MSWPSRMPFTQAPEHGSGRAVATTLTLSCDVEVSRVQLSVAVTLAEETSRERYGHSANRAAGFVRHCAPGTSHVLPRIPGICHAHARYPFGVQGSRARLAAERRDELREATDRHDPRIGSADAPGGGLDRRMAGVGSRPAPSGRAHSRRRGARRPRVPTDVAGLSLASWPSSRNADPRWSHHLRDRVFGCPDVPPLAYKRSLSLWFDRRPWERLNLHLRRRRGRSGDGVYECANIENADGHGACDASSCAGSVLESSLQYRVLAPSRFQAISHSQVDLLTGRSSTLWKHDGGSNSADYGYRVGAFSRARRRTTAGRPRKRGLATPSERKQAARVRPPGLAASSAEEVRHAPMDELSALATLERHLPVSEVWLRSSHPDVETS